MLSETMRRKLLAVANRWDSNGDGYVEESDYAEAAGRLAQLSGFPTSSPEYQNIYQQLTNGWDLMRQFDADGDGRVSAEECLGGFAALHEDSEKYTAVVVNPSMGIFDLIDSDHDGMITAAEHRAFLEAFSANENEIATAFAHLNLDGSGFITRDAFVTLVDEFFRSDDPSVPGAWLFGEL